MDAEEKSKAVTSLFTEPYRKAEVVTASAEAGTVAPERETVAIPQERSEEEGEKGVWQKVVEFFETKCEYDVYSREGRGTGSVQVVGQPVHGGYGSDSATADQAEESH